MAILVPVPAMALQPGDLAFIGFNADGGDDLAVVVLTEVVDEVIYLTDDESDGLGGKIAGEGVFAWQTGADPLEPGTVVLLSGLSTATPSATRGTLDEVDLGFDLAAAGDGVLAYQGPDHATPVTFLAGIKNAAGAAGDLTGTGLVAGTTFVAFSAGASDDGGAYVGPRTNVLAYADFLPLVHDPARWETATSDGTTLLPFSSVRFLAGADVPALGGLGLGALALGLGAAGAGALRRREEGAAVSERPSR